MVMMGKLSGSMKSDLVIPFKLNKKAAVAALKKHYGGKRLLPKVFKDENHSDEVKGIYVPFCLFDVNVEADVRYEATRQRHYSDRKSDYTETSYYQVDRRNTIAFRDIPVDGSSKMADDIMESIEPFDYSQAVPFQTAYLAGYLAENMISMRRKAGIVPMRVSKRAWRFPLPKQSKVIIPWLQRNQIPAYCPPEQNMPCFLCGICIPHGKKTNTSLP